MNVNSKRVINHTIFEWTNEGEHKNSILRHVVDTFQSVARHISVSLVIFLIIISIYIDIYQY